MSNSSRIAKNTLFLYLRSFVVLVISLYTSRKILEVLGIEDYGIYNVVGGVVGLMSFLNTSMAATYQRYFNYEMGKHNNNGLAKLFQSSLSVQLLYAILTILIAETLGLWFLDHKLIISPERIDAARWVYHISIASFALTMFQAPFTALIIAYEKMDILAYISILETVLKLAIVYMLDLSLADKLLLYGLLSFGVILLSTIMYMVVCRVKFRVCKIGLDWNRQNLKELIQFGGWGMLGSLAITLKGQGVSVVLNMFFGPVVNAAQGIANQIMNAVNQFVASFQSAFRPQLTKSYAEGDLSYMYKLYYTATKISFYLILVLSLPIIMETPMILRLWLGNNVPEHTVVFTRLTLLTTMIGAYANPTSCIAYAVGRIKWFTIIVSTLNLMIVPIAYIVLRMGATPKSALIVCLVITIFAQITRLLVLKHLEASFSLKHYLSKVIWPTLLVAMTSMIIPMTLKWFVSNSDSFLSSIIVGAGAIISVLLCVFIFGLDNAERTVLWSKFKHVIHK